MHKTAVANQYGGATQTVDLSAMGVADAAITFRIYLYKDANNAPSRAYLDNITLNGSVAEIPAAVPEPMTAGLLILSGTM